MTNIYGDVVGFYFADEDDANKLSNLFGKTDSMIMKDANKESSIIYVKQQTDRGTGLDSYEVVRLVNTTVADIADILDKQTINQIIGKGIEVIIE